MAKVEQSIEISAPVRTVYNQCTRFEEYPSFLEGVTEIRRPDERQLEWHASVGGREIVWHAEITEQITDRRIAWRSVSGRRNAGTIDFEPLAAGRTRITAAMDYEPQGALESMGSAFGVLQRRIESDLLRLKRFIEDRVEQTRAPRAEARRTAGSKGTQRQSAPRGEPVDTWEASLEAVRHISDQVSVILEGLMGDTPPRRGRR
jgi:uncharacterized membrane protein